MASVAALVAVHLTGFAALHSHMADLATPVTFYFITKFLDVAKASAGIALLLVGMVAVAGHVASLATAVATLLPLLLGLLAVTGNMAAPVAVVAGILGLFTVPGNVTLLSTAIAEQILSSSSAPAAATPSSFGTVLDPMPRTATSEALATAHLHNLP